MPVIFSLIILILLAIALTPYIGAFFRGVIFVVSLAVAAPAIHIFVGRDIKDRDQISDKIKFRGIIVKIKNDNSLTLLLKFCHYTHHRIIDVYIVHRAARFA